MIDISSLPEYELTGLEGFKAKELYKVLRIPLYNSRYIGSDISGVFLDHETARSFIKAMAEREIREAEEDPRVKNYEMFWDQDSNCDDGFSIVGYQEDGNQYCINYAISRTPLWYKP